MAQLARPKKTVSSKSKTRPKPLAGKASIAASVKGRVARPVTPSSSKKPIAAKAKPARPTARAVVASRQEVPAKKPTALKPARPAARATPAAASKVVRPAPPTAAVKPATNGKVLHAETATRATPVTSAPPKPSVPAAVKTKRNLAGLGAKELAHFRSLLIEKRYEILGDMHSMEREALRVDGGSLSTLPVHIADMGTDNYEQEFTLGLVEKERVLLREIYAALGKMQAGTYGVCEGTGTPIGKARLEVQPWARYSIEFARQREKSTMGIR